MPTTIQELRNHFFIVANWVGRDTPNDRIIFGDPDRIIKKVATGWSACLCNLEAAATAGCDLFISHEMFFGDKWAPHLPATETIDVKQRLAVLQKNNLACMNQHDTWDNFPEYGIRDSWHSFLNLGICLAERPYYSPFHDRYAPQNSLMLSKIKPQTLIEFAGFVTKQCSIFPSSPGVTIYGNPQTIVQTVATGVGCHIPAFEMLELGADVLILTFDRAFQNTIRIPLAEMGANIIVVEHGTSEMPGMQSMAVYLPRIFPEIETLFLAKEPQSYIVT